MPLQPHERSQCKADVVALRPGESGRAPLDLAPCVGGDLHFVDAAGFGADKNFDPTARIPNTPFVGATVFAGVHGAAVAAARGHFPEYPPSSPSAALVKDGEVVWMLHRHQIEGRHPQQIAETFAKAFAEHC